MNTLLKALRNRRKIVVIAGAGISVSAGIPDFRSSHGLFKSLRGDHKLKSSGKALFDASVYKDDESTSNFHDMVRKLSTMSQSAKPTAFHRLLARLSTEGRLLRLYTQNVDGLETSLPPLATAVPLHHKAPWPQTIQLHGGLEKMMCQKCRHISDFQPNLFEGPTPPPCPECVAQDTLRTAHAGKRSHGIGKLRPRMVLYNEQNPDDEAIGAVTTADFRTRPDAVIVVGTSMKIPTVRRIVHEMCNIVRDRREGTTIWINHDPAPTGKDLEDCWDLIVKGDCDEVARLAALREWDDTTSDIMEDYTESDLERVKSSQGEIQVEIPKTPRQSEAVVDIQAQAGMKAAAMTPPISQNGDAALSAKKKKQPAKSSPLKIRISLPLRRDDKTSVKNPASKGRSLSDVLVGKENKDKTKPKSKTSLNKKATYTKTNKPSQTQTTIMGRITKPQPSVVISRQKKTAEPLSPRRDSNVSAPPNHLAEYSSVETTPAPETPPVTEWRSPVTISPTGHVPPDMRRLLN